MRHLGYLGNCLKCKLLNSNKNTYVHDFIHVNVESYINVLYLITLTNVLLSFFFLEQL